MSIEAMKQALEALEKSEHLVLKAYTDNKKPKDLYNNLHSHRDVITALRTAIAEAEKQGPVAWEGFTNFPNPLGTRLIFTTKHEADKWLGCFVEGHAWIKPLSYTHPHPAQPKREWVGTLSLEQLLHTAANWGANYPRGEEFSDARYKKVQQWIEFYSGETYMNSAQPKAEAEKQGPVAIVGMVNTVVFKELPVGTKLYAHPQPKREWVGLTDAELEDAWPFVFSSHELGNKAIYQAIEAKLKENNT